MSGNCPAGSIGVDRNGGRAGKRYWLLSVSLLVAGIAGCQEPIATVEKPAVQSPPDTADSPAAASEAPVRPAQPATTPASGKTPKITVEKDVVDLGRVGMETKHKGQFQFTNTGTAPLKIIHVETCCGVVTKGVKDGQEYAPGQSGVLEFEYQTPDTPIAADLRKLQLRTNDPQQGITTLSIKAVVVRRVLCKPEVLRLYLKKENAGCPEIVVTGLDDQPFSITDFKATGNVMTAAFDPAVKATDFTLAPKVDLAKLAQNMRGQINISLSHPECSGVRVMFDTLPEFEISTPTIMMFGLKAGQPVQREFSIVGNYEENFEVESVSSEKGLVRLVGKAKIRNTCQLRIEVTPPERQQDSPVVSDMLEIKLNRGRTLTIPFRGFYQDK